MYTLSIKTHRYNARRYGRPWIALIVFDDSGKASYDWGTWLGTIDSGTGSDGELVISASDGDIVADGHKDHRSGNANVRYWQVKDGALVYLEGGKAEAYRLTMARQVM